MRQREEQPTVEERELGRYDDVACLHCARRRFDGVLGSAPQAGCPALLEDVAAVAGDVGRQRLQVLERMELRLALDADRRGNGEGEVRFGRECRVDARRDRRLQLLPQVGDALRRLRVDEIARGLPVALDVQAPDLLLRQPDGGLVRLCVEPCRFQPVSRQDPPVDEPVPDGELGGREPGRACPIRPISTTATVLPACFRSAPVVTPTIPPPTTAASTRQRSSSRGKSVSPDVVCHSEGATFERTVSAFPGAQVGKRLTGRPTFGKTQKVSRALLLVDLLKDFEHEDGDRLLDSFRQRHAGLTRALADARRAGLPIVYANDSAGVWDSDAPALVRRALEGKG